MYTNIEDFVMAAESRGPDNTSNQLCAHNNLHSEYSPKFQKTSPTAQVNQHSPFQPGLKYFTREKQTENTLKNFMNDSPVYDSSSTYLDNFYGLDKPINLTPYSQIQEVSDQHVERADVNESMSNSNDLNAVSLYQSEDTLYNQMDSLKESPKILPKPMDPIRTYLFQNSSDPVVQSPNQIYQQLNDASPVKEPSSLLHNVCIEDFSNYYNRVLSDCKNWPYLQSNQNLFRSNQQASPMKERRIPIMEPNETMSSFSSEQSISPGTSPSTQSLGAQGFGPVEPQANYSCTFANDPQQETSLHTDSFLDQSCLTDMPQYSEYKLASEMDQSPADWTWSMINSQTDSSPVSQPKKSNSVGNANMLSESTNKKAPGKSSISSTNSQWNKSKTGPRRKKSEKPARQRHVSDSSCMDAKRKHVCTFEGCNQAFVRVEHLRRHVSSIHMKERPYLCTMKVLCFRDKNGNQCVAPDKLDPNKEYYEIVCSKQFSRSDNFKQHQRTHFSSNR